MRGDPDFLEGDGDLAWIGVLIAFAVAGCVVAFLTWGFPIVAHLIFG
jgi:hypothetical protein